MSDEHWFILAITVLGGVFSGATAVLGLWIGSRFALRDWRREQGERAASAVASNLDNARAALVGNWAPAPLKAASIARDRLEEAAIDAQRMARHGLKSVDVDNEYLSEIVRRVDRSRYLAMGLSAQIRALNRVAKRDGKESLMGGVLVSLFNDARVDLDQVRESVTAMRLGEPLTELRTALPEGPRNIRLIGSSILESLLASAGRWSEDPNDQSWQEEQLQALRDFQLHDEDGGAAQSSSAPAT